MKRLVIIYGCPSVGKTSVLDRLIVKITNTGGSLIHPSSPNEIKGFMIADLFGKRVGVITFGDPGCEEEMEKCLNKCLAEGCDIIFTASRTRGDVRDIERTFAQNHNYQIVLTSPLDTDGPRIDTPEIKYLHQIFADMLYLLIL